MRIFIDRDRELSYLQKLILEDKRRRRLAIVRADTGMGKTALLDEIYDRHQMQASVALIDVGRTYGFLPFLNDVAEQLEGQGVRLDGYWELMNSLATEPPVAVQLSHVQATNSPIEVAIDATRKSRDVADFLLRQLLAEIEAAPSISYCLILIDRYELAETPLQDWFTTSLIPSILRRKATICVLAGCCEPELTHAERQNVEWLSLQELNTWHIGQWLVAAGVPQAKEFIEFLWQGTRGVPGNIQPFIINLVASQKSEANG